jgi:hypothetical protein
LDLLRIEVNAHKSLSRVGDMRYARGVEPAVRAPGDEIVDLVIGKVEAEGRWVAISR